MQTLTSISNFCARGPAGIRRVLFIAADDVVDLYFNELDRIDGIALKGGASFKEATFDLDTARVNQSQTRSDGFPKVKQSLTIRHNGIGSQALRAIKKLADHGKVHFIAITNQDQAFYFGINYFPEFGKTWESAENSSVASGRGAIGQIGGQVLLETTLEAQTRFFAPEVDLDFSTISIDPIEDPDPVADITPPVALIFSPPDEGVGISITPAIFVIFNEAVKSALVGGTLKLWDWDTDTEVGSWNLDNPAEVQFDSVSNELRVLGSVDPLSYNTRYYITVTAGGVEDIAGNDWPGVTVKGDWDFWTGSPPDVTAPTVIDLTPDDDATGVIAAGLSLSIQFDEDVKAGIGVFEFYDYSDDSLVGTIDVNSSLVTISGDTVTIDGTGLFADNKHYYVLVSSGVVQDIAGNPWAGFASNEDWDFETDDNIGPVALTYFPAVFSTDISKNTEIYVDFGEVVQLGSSGIIKLVRYVDGTGPDDEAGNDLVVHTWDVATTVDLPITNGGTRVNFDNHVALIGGALYYFVIPADAIQDASGNDWLFHHISDPGLEAYWTFTIASDLVWQLGPTNGSTGVNKTFDPILHAGYTRGIGVNNGWIFVRDYDTDVLLEAIGVGVGATNQHTRFLSLMENGGDNFEFLLQGKYAGRHIYIEIPAGMFYDPIHGDLHPGTDKTTWHFTFDGTGTAPTLVSSDPADGTEVDWNPAGADHIKLEWELDQQVNRVPWIWSPADLCVRAYDFDTGDEVLAISIANSNALYFDAATQSDNSSKYWRLIIPEGFLDNSKKYCFKIDAGAFQNPCGDTNELINIGCYAGPDYDPDAADAFDSGFDTGFN